MKTNINMGSWKSWQSGQVEETATPRKLWKVEYAKTSRSSCRTCQKTIQKETLRLGKMVQSSHFDGFMPMWNHGHCIFKQALTKKKRLPKKVNRIKSLDDVEGIDLLRWEDQEKIRKYIEDGPTSSTGDEYGIEVSRTSRATCKRCNQKITEGELRISIQFDGRGILTWQHVSCFMESFPSIQVEKLSGWHILPLSDQEALCALIKKDDSAAKKDVEDKKLAQSSTSRCGTKRKNYDSNDQKSKIPKAGEDFTKLEAQSKALWALKDELRGHVTTLELRAMLEINGQDSTGSELDLRDRCADGMMFGALDCCPICSGSLHYSGGEYCCHGYMSAWSKCAYSTAEPKRIKGKWEIPEGTDNQYLCKWFRTQKGKKPVRLLPPLSNKSSGSRPANGLAGSSKGELLEDLKVAISGLSKKSIEELKRKIVEAGVLIHAKIEKDTDCLVVSGALDALDPEFRKARRMTLPIVGEDYLVDCIKRKKKLPFGEYKLEGTGQDSSIVTVTVKGRSAVHEASCLQYFCHILEDEKSIYNTTLNMSDLSTGINSYYILQIIEEDKGSECYVFRKWGRVGNDKIGGSKLEEMEKSEAIKEFKRLFLEKTGNSWEAWELKENFQKQPGRFFPLDIDYGVNKQVSKKKSYNEGNSQLAPPLVELMKMLFNVETYRAAMMEFEVNMSEMPLGKLSKSNIQKGFEALTEIQNLLESSNHNPFKESLLIDANNRFFTVIPSIYPHVIRDEDDFKSKVKMLEALQDIEIASSLVGFDDDDDNDESLDEKYKKLRCNITPLPHDSEDYRLVEKYLLTTHASTHKDWTLELEDVFTIEREGEFDKFAPYREKLQNRMLLWHGSRLTNFVGILSQGLRIAPPEAPATGYMFGKGIYFADLVSKSAQYCYTDRQNPVGFMLLSEVALGEVYQLKKASYMEKPPQGKHSTKGLGKKKPKESDYVKWRDEVVVPCGKPVLSNVNSELMYNEYIVYDTAQVKLQFLLKVRFHHKIRKLRY